MARGIVLTAKIVTAHSQLVIVDRAHALGSGAVLGLSAHLTEVNGLTEATLGAVRVLLEAQASFCLTDLGLRVGQICCLVKLGRRILLLVPQICPLFDRVLTLLFLTQINVRSFAHHTRRLSALQFLFEIESDSLQ